MDYPLPEETSIYFSKTVIFFNFLILLGVFFTGLYIAIGTEQYFGGFGLSAFSIFLSFFVS